jgi:hypothetical protein
MDSVRNDAGKLQRALETASKLLGAAHPAVEAARKDILRLQHQEQVEHFTTHKYPHTLHIFACRGSEGARERGSEGARERGSESSCSSSLSLAAANSYHVKPQLNQPHLKHAGGSP